MLRLWKALFFILISHLIFTPLFAAVNKTNDSLANFLVLADIHFDPFFSCHNVTPCPLIEKLRRANANEWPRILAAYDFGPPLYRQDTNYPLLISALAASKQAASAKHAQFVLVLGDFLGHDFRAFYNKYSTDQQMDGYQSFVRKTFEFLNNELSQTFPSIDVYSIVGNNDSYQDDYFTNIHGRFFKDAGIYWSRLIKTKTNRALMQKEFSSAGYYAVDLPNQSNMRLIVLNTNLFSYKARGRNLDRAANAELDWLHYQLQSAKKNNQKVFVAMHIPVGIDIYRTLKIRLLTIIELWQATYSKRFQAELRQFAPEIAGIFTGHLHSDGFQILTFDSNEIPSTGTPSISPIFGNNPGFKIYTYSPQSQQLIDFITYYYPLNKGRGWETEYDFNHIFGQCHACPIIDGMDLLQQHGTLAHFYKLFYAVKTDSQPITSKWYPYYWCAIREMNASEYRECVE